MLPFEPTCYENILDEFWSDCQVFYDNANNVNTNQEEQFEKKIDEEEERKKGGAIIECPPLIMNESDLKWSENIISPQEENDEEASHGRGRMLFPDLNIKIVNELIGTGGVLAKIPLKDVGQG